MARRVPGRRHRKPEGQASARRRIVSSRKLNARSENSPLENEVLRAAARKGAPDPAEEAADIAMETKIARQRVCAIVIEMLMPGPKTELAWLTP